MLSTVIIITIDRSECVRTCLSRLAALDHAPDQVIVVDASRDDLTRKVVDEFAGVDYLWNGAGDGNMTASRNLGIKHAVGDVIAFIDDDAYVHPGWLDALLACYADPSVGAVGGRALRNQAGEDREGVDQIGLLTPNGIVIGNFAADPGRVIEVMHLIGCNMSFRREVLAECGGFRKGYPGYCLREETDLFLLIHKLGHRVLFTPFAVVDHVAAPKARGRRFDVRYEYYAERNHYVLLIRNFGALHPIVWRYGGAKCLSTTVEVARQIGGAVARVFAVLGGGMAGIVVGTWLRATQGRSPMLRDADGIAVAEALKARPDAAARAFVESQGGILRKVRPCAAAVSANGSGVRSDE